MKQLENLLSPDLAIIKSVVRESQSIKSFELRFAIPQKKRPVFLPGRFVEVSVFGFGEMPISVASSHLKKDSVLLSVNNIGNVSSAMHRLKKGDVVGLRGPYGNGFPLQKFFGKNIVIVAGGCGFAGLRSLVETIELQRSKFGNVDLFYGARSASDVVYKRDLQRWGKKRINVQVSVDSGKKGKFFVGFVTELIKQARLNPKDSVVAFCGPGKMTEFAVEILKKKGFKEKQMFLSLERLMHCGMGKCAHCNFGHKYVCIDGPVFCLQDIKHLPWKKE